MLSLEMIIDNKCTHESAEDWGKTLSLIENKSFTLYVEALASSQSSHSWMFSKHNKQHGLITCKGLRELIWSHSTQIKILITGFWDFNCACSIFSEDGRQALLLMTKDAHFNQSGTAEVFHGKIRQIPTSTQQICRRIYKKKAMWLITKLSCR